ncbi:hypothetical protein F1880_008516 [Penicillium rolfsii]|nr:hypothetical protein F1880_008516 [Penicillium rolfsii]
MVVEFSSVIEGFGDEAPTMERGFKTGDEVFGQAYGGTQFADEIMRAYIRWPKLRLVDGRDTL